MKSLFCPKISKNYANIRGKPQKSTFLTPKQMSVPMVRIETMVLMGVDMPVEAIRGQMASAIDVIIHLGRSFDGSRKLMEISEITGMAASQVALHPLFEMNEDDELTMRSELYDQKKLKEYGQYEAYQKLMESFKARDQPVEI